DHLSVQVHPDDACASRLGEPDVGKTEMWHVLRAQPGSELICGMDRSVTPDQFSRSVHDNSLGDLLTRFDVAPGDSVFVPAGTVHAIGGGIVLAEIQQNSDLTYRIYDWGRLQADGTPRQLHVDKALQAIHFGSKHGATNAPLAYQSHGGQRTVLAACRYFAAESVEVHGTLPCETRADSFHIILAKSGSVSIEAGQSSRQLKPGECALVPGHFGRFAVTGPGAFLDYYVPDLDRDVFAPLVGAGHNETDIVRLGGEPTESDLRGH
ncbi:MAG: class I mannose-6-phosphate isomerase, partial [Candidatus Hydrogenedentes bacterium]|nr:class I mannose-6-phosphate isomerase [Candidatus Hydrogenedentota bacterium]